MAVTPTTQRTHRHLAKTVKRGLAGVAVVAALVSCGDAQPPAQAPSAGGGSRAGSSRSGPATPPQDTASRIATASHPDLPVRVSNADGSVTTVTSDARIVTLDGDITETVYALGLGSHVVGTDTSSTYPKAATRLHTIGYQSQLSAEPIVALSPTVVNGSTNAGPASVVTQLRNAGIPVVIVKDYQEYTGALDKITAVSRALGVSAEGRALRNRVKASIARAEAAAGRVGCHPRVVLLHLRGAGVQLMAGAGSGYTAILGAAGGVDAGSQSGVHGFSPITPEALVRARPQIIVATTTGLASIGGLAGLLKVPGVAQTPAGRGHDVVTFEDDFLLNNGPRVGRLLTELTNRFAQYCSTGR